MPLLDNSGQNLILALDGLSANAQSGHRGPQDSDDVGSLQPWIKRQNDVLISRIALYLIAPPDYPT